MPYVSVTKDYNSRFTTYAVLIYWFAYKETSLQKSSAFCFKILHLWCSQLASFQNVTGSNVCDIFEQLCFEGSLILKIKKMPKASKSRSKKVDTPLRQRKFAVPEKQVLERVVVKDDEITVIINTLV